MTHLERTKETLVDAHHCTGIVEFTAIVGRTEQGDQLSLGEEFVPILDDLMSAAYQIHVVFLQEARHHVRTKRKRHSPIVFTPSGDVLVRVGPEKVTEKTTIGNLYSLAC